MESTSHNDGGETGLLVRITPSQSAFFAGETFAATITFTNPAPVVPIPSLHSLHSLSQSSLPRTAPPTGQPPPLGSRRWKGSQPDGDNWRGRTLSASHLGLAEYASSHLDSDEVPPSPTRASMRTFSHHDQGLPSPVTPPPPPPHIPPNDTSTPPLSSYASTPFTSPNKPSNYSSHSLLPSSTNSSPRKPTHHPYSQQHRDLSTALSSTFSLAPNGDGFDDDEEGSDFDPTDSTTHIIPGQGFYGLGRNDTMDSVVRDGVEDWTRKATSEGPSQLAAAFSPGIGLSTLREGEHSSPPPPLLYPGTTSNRSLHPPNTITVLWSFAHLEGTFEVEDALIKPTEFEQVKRSLLGGVGSDIGLGGGTLQEPQKRSGWGEWLFGAPAPPVSPVGGNAAPKRAAATLEERRNLTMKEKSVPTFSSPPSMLGVDLVLEPGQSKTYSFSIQVPADLPPSFRGKSIRFSYHLVVGTNRSRPGIVSPGPGSAKGSISRVMRVPVRVYNHVGVTGARPFYDLTNPIVYHRDEATISGIDDPKVQKKARRPSNGSGRAEFEAYSMALLDSLGGGLRASSSANVGPMMSPTLEPLRSPTLMEAPPSLRPEMRPRTGSGGHSSALLLDDEGMGCKAAVEIVSRNSQKVSYDINKDGYMVASLTLVKSSYRLGETVNGSVVINSGEGRVLRVSARLETHELIETSISTKPAPQVRQITRRLHAEHHETTLDSARIGFALAIPSGATPDFATSGVKLQWSVRLSFLVIPPSPDSPMPQPGPPGRSGRSGASAPNGNAPAGRHGRSKSFGYGFEPAVPLTLPAAPLVQPTGAAHLMPVYGPQDSSPAYTSFRAVPDLGFVPVLFSSSTPVPEALPTPGPLQRTAAGASHRSSASLSLPRTSSSLTQQASVVLVPAKVETVECSIPIKVYPGNTPFRPTISVFEDTR